MTVPIGYSQRKAQISESMHRCSFICTMLVLSFMWGCGEDRIDCGDEVAFQHYSLYRITALDLFTLWVPFDCEQKRGDEITLILRKSTEGECNHESPVGGCKWTFGQDKGIPQSEFRVVESMEFLPLGGNGMRLTLEGLPASDVYYGFGKPNLPIKYFVVEDETTADRMRAIDLIEEYYQVALEAFR